MPISSKGAANVFVIIAIVAAVAVGGYFLMQKGGLPTPSGGGTTLTQRATEADFEFIEDPTLRKHFVAQANQTTYRTKSTGSGSGLTIVNEVQIKGDSFNTSEVQSDGNKEIKHTITIGDTIYLKDYSDKKWWKQEVKYEPTKDEGVEKEEPVDFKEEYSKPNLEFKSLGKEACGNLTCFKYEQYDPENPEVKRTFWFDNKEYLLRKEQGGFGEFISTIEYTYDGINVQTPSPIKDVPEGRSIYEYSSGSAPTAPAIPSTTEQMPQIPQDYTDSGDDSDY